MSSKSSNQINVPEARQAMNTLKQEVASELGITLKQGYNGDIAAKDAGHIGGNMVKNICPARTALYTRTSITAPGRKVVVRYIASLAV